VDWHFGDDLCPREVGSSRQSGFHYGSEGDPRHLIAPSRVLAHLRQRHGLRMEALADMLGVDPSTVRAWEQHGWRGAKTDRALTRWVSSTAGAERPDLTSPIRSRIGMHRSDRLSRDAADGATDDPVLCRQLAFGLGFVRRESCWMKHEGGSRVAVLLRGLYK
jgi:transcriptional regulator with XRE-family HTH domain